MANAIVGSNGFIGSALKRYADRYLIDEEWVGITRENRDQWIGYHFNKTVWAAGSARKDLSENELHDLHIGALTEYIARYKFEKFIYISSQAVYGDSAQSGREDDKISLDISDYGVAKFTCETLVRAFKSYLIIRPNGFTGPGLKKNVIHSMAKTPPEMYYTWDSKAQYIHVDHFAHILFKLASKYSGEIFNVTSPDVVTPVDVANILGVDIKTVKFPTDRILPTVRAVLDTTKMESALRDLWEPLPSSKEAIRLWNEPFKIPVSEVRKSMGGSTS